jgi:TusE/DsrC/DsvC family sulfur relay protein
MSPESFDAPQSAAEFDEDGFLRDPSRWNERLAMRLARQDGFDVLTEQQWRVIRALRNHYLRHHSIASPRSICHACEQDDYCLDRLFNHDGKEAWRIAGLPNPGEEAKTYM